MIRALLFDMDGVLVDSFDVWVQVMNGAAERLGHAPISRAQIERTWGQGIQSDVENYYPGAAVPELEALFESLFWDQLDHLVIMDGARALLEWLVRERVPYGVVTNTPRDLALRMLDVAQLPVRVVVGGTEVPAPKPAPDMVLRACEQLGVRASEVAMVGDSPYDQEAAESAGARFLGFGGIPGDPTVTHLDQVREFWLRCDSRC